MARIPGEPSITVDELISQLKAFPGDMLVDFSSLDFYRLKRRSDTQLQVEFSEMVYRDENGQVQVDNPE